MTSHCKHQAPGLGSRARYLAAASLAALIMSSHSAAASDKIQRLGEAVDTRRASEPILAVVSLRSQRITVYDANGWILRAPVSTGGKGRETPAGVFSVIQKAAEHYSNLYADGYMPHMQRITWSGIALHGGALPGYPASHGCVRMPFDFAARLFEASQMGMRIIISPNDVAPNEIAHSTLFFSKPMARDLVVARVLEAEEAARKAGEARLVAVKASREAVLATRPMRLAQNLRLRAQAELAAALSSETETDSVRRFADSRAQLIGKIAGLDEQVASAKAELQPIQDAATRAREAAAAAESARVAAAEAAREAAKEPEPVSVFISRKTQRLYVRQAFQPIMESPITILEAERQIGTHVFTAVERFNDDGAMRWSVVSLNNSRPGGSNETKVRAGRGHYPGINLMSGDSTGAKSALDRILIPREVLERITGMASLRSSLIISDEAMSSETGNGTDFVVVMSEEPQGSIKSRLRRLEARLHDTRPRDRW